LFNIGFGGEFDGKSGGGGVVGLGLESGVDVEFEGSGGVVEGTKF